MRALYYFIISFIFVSAGIPLTYFGYEDGVDASESGDNNDTGYSLMMAFGLLFLMLSVIIFGFGIYRKNRETRK